jgi:hypothetical protein
MEEAHAVDIESAALLSAIADQTEGLDPDVVRIGIRIYLSNNISTQVS